MTPRDYDDYPIGPDREQVIIDYPDDHCEGDSDE